MFEIWLKYVPGYTTQPWHQMGNPRYATMPEALAELADLDPHIAEQVCDVRIICDPKDRPTHP